MIVIDTLRGHRLDILRAQVSRGGETAQGIDEGAIDQGCAVHDWGRRLAACRRGGKFAGKAASAQ
jgi:hypothetical protein